VDAADAPPMQWGGASAVSAAEDASAAAVVVHKKDAMRLMQDVGYTPGWEVPAVLPETKHDAREEMRIGGAGCELCRWKDDEGVVARMEGVYNEYATFRRGGARIWSDIARMFNEEFVRAVSSFGGVLMKTWTSAVGRPPREVTPEECREHFTGACGVDIVRPHQRKRLEDFQDTWDALARTLPRARAASAGVGGGAAFVHPYTPDVRLMVKLNTSMLGLERVLEARRAVARRPAEASRATAAASAAHGVNTKRVRQFSDP